jgi:phosphoribosyl-ATP pyrophosphohydrolase
MNAKQYVEHLLIQQAIGWVSMFDAGENTIEVNFREEATDMEPVLEKVGAHSFTHLHMFHRLKGLGCMAVITVNPRYLEEPTLASAVEAISASTAAFHERFDTASWSSLMDAWDVMDEEFGEVVHEIVHTQDKAAIASEMADLFVTMLGVLSFADISEAEFAAALVRVAAKNDAKTDETHVIYQGKVTRRSKVEGLE